MSVNSSQAFWGKNQNKTQKEIFLSNKATIDKKFRSADGSIYSLKFEIYIPVENGEIAILTDYDEASERTIKDLVWIVQNKSTERSVSKLSVKESVNKIYEQIATESNPGLAYDRLSQEKHIISKIFYFPKSTIIPKKIKTNTLEDNFLEIVFANDDIKRIPINNDIYKEKEFTEVKLPVKRSKENDKAPVKIQEANIVKATSAAPVPASTNNASPAPEQPVTNDSNNPYLQPSLSEEGQDLLNLKNELDQFSREVYPQNYNESESGSTLDQSEDADQDTNALQQMIDDEYYGEEDEEEDLGF